MSDLQIVIKKIKKDCVLQSFFVFLCHFWALLLFDTVNCCHL